MFGINRVRSSVMIISAVNLSTRCSIAPGCRGWLEAFVLPADLEART